MSIKCGRCAQRHETVSEVKACYNGQTVPSSPEPVASGARATAKQAKFLASLLDRAGARLESGDAPDALDKRRASVYIDGMIDHLKGKRAKLPFGVVYALSFGERMRAANHLPPTPAPVVEQDRWKRDEREAAQRTPYPNVPAGHYAVPSLTGVQDLDFFRVDRPVDGRWAGRTFVKRVIGGRADVAVRGATARSALTAILAAGASAAAVRYGQEIGRCYRCNRHLTDETSRALGIGPDCRSK